MRKQYEQFVSSHPYATPYMDNNAEQIIKTQVIITYSHHTCLSYMLSLFFLEYYVQRITALTYAS